MDGRTHLWSRGGFVIPGKTSSDWATPLDGLDKERVLTSGIFAGAGKSR
jgi:hypothetical protein